MSGERTLTVLFDGKDVGLGKTASSAATELDAVDDAGQRAAGGASTATSKIAGLGAAVLGSASTFMGAKDAYEGWGQILHGNMDGIDKVIGGIGAMGSGMALLISAIPEQVTTWVVGHAQMAASALASFASQIAEWVVLAATSLASAASVALAWIISMGPIALVIAAVIGLVVLIVKNWDTIKRVTVEVFSAVWGFVSDNIGKVVDLVKRIPGLVTGALGNLASAFLEPWRLAFEGIRAVWNATVGGKGFSVPSWIPGIGGKSFTIPRLAAGGIVTGPTVALLGEGGSDEAVIPLDGRHGLGGGGPMTLVIDSGGSNLDRLLVDVLRRAVQNQGGNVQMVLGGGGR